VLAYVAAKYFMARPPKSVFARNASNLSRRLIEEGNPPVLVDAENPLVETAEDDFEPLSSDFCCHRLSFAVG
jgi:hypothetical protein